VTQVSVRKEVPGSVLEQRLDGETLLAAAGNQTRNSARVVVRHEQGAAVQPESCRRAEHPPVSGRVTIRRVA
jgi:hypothetical protein